MIRTKRTEQAKNIYGINITPFTDVCLVLLIIFMVTAPALIKKDDTGFKVPLPKADNAQVLPMAPLVVRITRDEQIFLNNKAVTFDTLAPELQAYPKGVDGKLMLVVKADANVPYRLVIKAIDIAGQAGVTDTMLATQPKTVDQQPNVLP